MSGRVTVADLVLEGGGATVLGTRVDGRWSFWHEGSSIALDENDDEEWRAWASDQSADLAAVVPGIWPLMYPVAVHQEFVGWFRDHYEAARAGLDGAARADQERWQDRRWQEVFAGRSVVGHQSGG